jgi:Lhr-like helicase
MRIYCYKELRSKDIDELLDLLSVYIELKKDIYSIIKKDPENEDFYKREHLYYYELNIRKIKNELEIKSEIRSEMKIIV